MGHALVDGIAPLYKSASRRQRAGDLAVADTFASRSIMKLSLVSIEKAGYVRLAAEGDITSRDFLDSGGKNPLETILGANWASNNLMVSLEHTAFIDSSAIGWLIDAQRKSKAAGGKLVLHSAPPRVRDVFELLKMRVVLNLKDDETSAREFITANGEAK
jgi:anti-anti-sigma factor